MTSDLLTQIPLPDRLWVANMQPMSATAPPLPAGASAAALADASATASAAASKVSSLGKPLNRSGAKSAGKSQPSASTQRPMLGNFIAGPENRLASYCCTTEASLWEQGNPILIYGPSGTGKSVIARCLLESQCRRWKFKRVCIEPAIDFARRFAAAVDSDTINEFRNSVLDAQVMLIEDVHMLVGKSAAQNELAMRIDQRTQMDQPTIVTCRRLPSEIEGLRSGLVSRLLPGLSIPLSPPGPAARRKILAEYAALREIKLSDEQIEQLNAQLPGDAAASQLCAAVQQLSLTSLNRGADQVADQDITDVTTSLGQTEELPMSKIARAVARQFKLKTADLKSASRRQRVVRARNIAMFLGRRLTRHSLQAIGQYFGGRDHSTVIHAIRSAEQLIGNDPSIARVTEDVTERLKTA